ncbi:lysophospholipid acyltransferase family protein [Yanshouia hominis]|uniref:1-acyl-sn-glycerol-3-phosphate acyltransferase n=1 Tax=Yanshouia hominis TaxID=2763673 RepID=A0ABR7NI75_9FIRM|nr:lysophospholipid acyltransferase family protein [Yanshouia hominis]MBC8575532.1 1-acyl-sn-glycerol-3-phosphate acyltransferase [Yanshouia hominis]
MRTILWFLYFWLYLLAVEPWLWKVRALKRQGRTEEHDILAGRIIHNWARRLLAAAGARVTVEGLENLPEGTAVFVSNHQSYFDIPLALGYLGDPKGLVSKKEIDRIPFIRQWMRELGCVFLDRENLRASVSALGDASDRVAAGYSMVVFPEGTRSETGEVGEFKAGAFKIAQKNKVPVVPFVLEGSSRLMGKHSLWIHPASVTVKILEPIDTSCYSREEWRALPALAERRVKDGLALLRAGGAER